MPVRPRSDSAEFGGLGRVPRSGPSGSIRLSRTQFGRPIGSFRAIKHRLADTLVDVESARSAVQFAAWCADERPEDLPLLAAVAQVAASEAFLRAAGTTIQVHGGIGFTWEHPAHLYFRRAKSSAMLFGDPVEHRELVARHLGI